MKTSFRNGRGFFFSGGVSHKGSSKLHIMKMPIWKSLVGVGLAVILAVTGQSMAASRGATAATGQMVICVGTTAVVVYTDANGQPTAAPHICPDCILLFDTVKSADVSLQSLTFAQASWRLGSLGIVSGAAQHASFRPRAPPRVS